MAEELSDEIRDFIDEIKITTKKEKRYVIDNNWTTIQKAEIRESEHDLQNLLVTRSLANAESLFKLAKADLKVSAVKVMLDELISLFRIYDERASKYLREQDWSSLLEQEDGGGRAAMKSEIEFQSLIQKHLVDYRGKVRKLNYSEESNNVDIGIFGDTRIPLMMSGIIEERYPEVTELLKVKREKYYKEHPVITEVKKKSKK